MNKEQETNKEKEDRKKEFLKEAQRLRKRFSNDEVTDEERAQDSMKKR